jgi:acyl-CoA thioesterase-1
VSRRLRFALGAAAIAGLLASAGASSAVAPAADAPDCASPPALTALDGALDRTAALVDQGKSVIILAIGSSSTLGIGASTPAMSYPSRLERALNDALPTVAIRVVNHGRGGQDAGEELARLNRDLADEHPDLVIWQVGTNAVLRHDDLAADEQLIGWGVAAIKEAGVDVVLMDLQYAPRVLARPAWGEMEQRIAEIARRTRVGLFRRFAIMREWDRTGQLKPAAAIGRDGLHMTDVSYNCLAEQLSHSLVAQWRGQGKIAKSMHRRPDAVAVGDRLLVKAPR